MRYDPHKTPDAKAWLALDEGERIELIAEYHRQTGVELPNAQLHAAIHTVVENQLAEGLEVAREALARLRAEGLDRHDAIHAIGSVAAEHMWMLLREKPKAPDPNALYAQALRSLTARSWMEGGG